MSEIPKIHTSTTAPNWSPKYLGLWKILDILIFLLLQSMKIYIILNIMEAKLAWETDNIQKIIES